MWTDFHEIVGRVGLGTRNDRLHFETERDPDLNPVLDFEKISRNWRSFETLAPFTDARTSLLINLQTQV